VIVGDSESLLHPFKPIVHAPVSVTSWANVPDDIPDWVMGNGDTFLAEDKVAAADKRTFQGVQNLFWVRDPGGFADLCKVLPQALGQGGGGR
jgi:hypothetical protein